MEWIHGFSPVSACTLRDSLTRIHRRHWYHDAVNRPQPFHLSREFGLSREFRLSRRFRQFRRFRRFRLPAAMAVTLMLAACGNEPETLEMRGRTMGTSYSVRIVAPADGSPVALDALRQRVAARLEELDNLFSTYRPDSEVSRFNAHPGLEWFGVSPDFLAVLEQSVVVNQLTGGAFDATVGPLVELWGFGASGEAGRISQGEGDLASPDEAGRMPTGEADGVRGGEADGIRGGEADGVRGGVADGIRGGDATRLPPREAVERLLAATGFTHLQLRESPPAVRRLRPGVQLDFSGIAKGYAVDEVWNLLSEAGLSGYLVEIGGEVRGRGTRADGRDWSIGIETPGETGVTEAVPLRDAAIATSGDYRNYFEHEGRRYSHVVDPRNGWPVAHELTAVTVISATAAKADALATALLVLGPTAGLELAEREQIAALLVVRSADGPTILRTTTFEAARDGQ